jgi:heat-inducible transcriptional repressor
MRLIGEKQALTGLLEGEMTRAESQGERALRPIVRIGEESGLPELAGLSLISTTYKRGGKVVGVLGIMGSKRMEYSRMMSLVEYLSGVVSRKLMDWDETDGE